MSEIEQYCVKSRHLTDCAQTLPQKLKSSLIFLANYFPQNRKKKLDILQTSDFLVFTDLFSNLCFAESTNIPMVTQTFFGYK